MPYHRLGRSGLKVSALCLGSNMLGSYVDEAGAHRVMDAAFDVGVNFIDTADAYTGGASETIIGKGVKSKRHQWVVGTKIFMPTGNDINARGGSRKHIIEATDACLSRLGTDYVDLMSMHRYDLDTPLEETMIALNDLVRQGKVRYIGNSNWSAWQTVQSLWISDKLNLERFVCTQPSYSLLNRDIEEEVVPMAKAHEVAITPFSVLQGGLLTGRYEANQAPPPGSRFASRPQMMERMFTQKVATAAAKLKEVSKKYEKPVPALLIGWALANPAVTSVIIGASKPEQAVQNAKAVEKPLTPEEMKAVEEAVAL